MSHPALVRGPEDTAFFPEIDHDGRSSYSSPLADILSELRRKYVVAAAATSGPRMSLKGPSDQEEIGTSRANDSCTCHTVPVGREGRTRRFGGASFGREESLINLSSLTTSSSGVCADCGKKKPFDPIGEVVLLASTRKQKHFRHGKGALRVRSGLGPPNHAEALLHTTPHLRHLSPASMDMQGAGNLASSRGILSFVLPTPKASPNPTTASINALEPGQTLDYRSCLARDKANEKAALELANFLWILSHEMSLEDCLSVETKVFTSIFTLVHSQDNARRMAGVAALDALMDIPSADEEKKAIKFAGALSSALKAPQADYNFLAAVARALGRFVTRATNVDTVEAEATRALEWLRLERSDRRLSACLSLKALAVNAPTAFYTKTSTPRSTETIYAYGDSNEFLDNIIPVIRDPQPIVRACAADALSQCLKVLIDRTSQPPSLICYLTRLYNEMMQELVYDPSKKQSAKATRRTEAAQHGSLLQLASMLEYADDFMHPRFDPVCTAVMKFTKHPKAVIRLEVIRLIPRLARMSPDQFSRRLYLEESLTFLMDSAANPPQPRVGIDIRPAAYTSLGQLIVALNDPSKGVVYGAQDSPGLILVESEPTDEVPKPSLRIERRKKGIIYEKLGEIFGLVQLGLKRKSRSGASSKAIGADTKSSALNCGADLVEALGETAVPYISGLINDILDSGLSEDLIHCLHSIAVCVPAQSAAIEDRLVQEVSLCLAGTREAAAICDPLSSFISATEISDHSRADREIDSVVQVDADLPRVTINSSQKPDVVKRLVLSLFTLGSFGDGQGNVNTSGTVVSVLPFVENVAACYLFHGSDEVRRAAALTCCTLLVLPEGDSRASPTATDQISCLGSSKHIGTGLNRVVEAVLKRLLRVATSDPSPVVRLCVIRALDSRYDAFLCQTHHLQALFMVLEDEVVAARASGLKLLGRLVRLNPAPVLPVMRKFLVDLMVDMRCGGDKRRGREDATRLLEVLLRAEALRRLVQPVLASIINSLPLTEVAPRLASAALETLGELALATGSSLKPWIHQLVPQIMETMQDQSSVSKQLISLRTLGQISGSTGYVISPYLDYPQLLSQAADVLPGTKRAPWALRREVIRTLGILGALDPDKYNSVVPTTRKGGAAGGAYFLEQDDSRSTEEIAASRSTMTTGPQPNMKEGVPSRENDDDLPAHLFMYEQYAMVAQPVLNVVPPRRITPADEDFYPTVTIQALTRIFKDPSLAVHHGQVLQAIMYIFQSLKLHCVPYLKKVVPHMIYTVKTCGPFALREALLKHLATLSGLVGEHLRPYVADIFDVMDAFWSTRHLAAVLALVSKIAAGVPDEFREYVPRFVQRVLASLSDIHSSDWLMPQSRNETPGSASLEIEKLQLILESLRHLRGVLQDFLHVLIPALLKLAESLVAPSASALGPNGVTQSTLSDTAALTFMTLSALLAHDSSSPSSLETFSSLRSSASFTLGTSLAARATQPLVRLLGRDFNSNGVVGQEIVKTLCVCATQLGPRRWKSLYHEVTRKAICEWEDRIRSYENLQSVRNSTQSVSNEALFGLHLYDQVISSLEIPTGRALRSSSGSTDARAFIYQSLSRQNSLLRPRDPPERLRGFDAASGLNDSSEALDSSITPLLVQGKVNQANLQLAWDVSRRSSKEDWDEWMRKFAIELLREAPSPALRSCAGLAHAYPPLARELFSSAFVCCWADLDDEFRNNLVYSLETAFSADVSPEILQTLLNLAEFMEHGGIEGPLPIDISILADLALKCRAYAKALHYKEREYNEGDVSGACVESLISINSKLDLPEAALGVLKAARIRHESSRLQYSGGAYSSHPPKAVERHMLYSVMTTTDEIQGDREGESWDLFEVQESWLAKLGSFTEALAVYDEKLASNPDNFDAILGSMRCLDATGDWRQVLALAERSWEALAGESQQLDGLADDNMPASFSSQFIYPRERRKALRFCARAAWRLDQWDELEKYASQLVRGEVDPKTSKKTQLVGRRSGDFGESPPSVDFDGAFYTAVLQVHRKEWSLAREAIDAARAAMDSRFTALMAESYKRAYPSMVTAQTLSEMEEIISYRMLEERYAASENRHPINRPDKDKARSELLSIWSDRLAGCREDADVYSSILAVRSLVLDPSDCVDCILTQSELSRQAHRFKLAERVLLEPLTFLGADINGSIFGFGLPESLGLGLVQSHPENPEINASIIDRLVNGESKAFSPKYGTIHERYSAKVVQEAGGLDKLSTQHQLYFAYVRHLWATDKREEAMHRLSRLSDVVDLVSCCEGGHEGALRVACWLELGEWRLEQASTRGSSISDSLQVDALGAFRRATSSDSCGYSAWHAWALLNFRIAEQMRNREERSSGRPSQQSKRLANHVCVAVKGFVNAISCGTKRWSASVQQDLLNLLTCLFQYGELSGVASAVNEGMRVITLEAWLGVLPQLLARIHMRTPSVRSVLHPLLVRLGENHPQALMYPLSVLVKSPVTERKAAAESLMNSLKEHSSSLVDEALLVSSELIRVAILWLEQWNATLDDASRVLYEKGNVAGFLDLLLPLHEEIERGGETQQEKEFLRNYGEELAAAHGHMKAYMDIMKRGGLPIPSKGGFDASGQYESSGCLSQAEGQLNKAWDIYYTVFRRINRQLPPLTKLQLRHCSPALSRAHNLELGIPGSYRVDGSYTKIERFVENMHVITSKQRPRKISLRGSDGKDYVYLLKGHEDLRQDERVMQLFGLVNALLARDRQTKKHDLNIQRYTIVPLSHDCGLVGWVPHSDTLHSLVRDYRQNKKIRLNMESHEMTQIAPDYDLLPVLQKVEVFTEALRRAIGRGNDLYEILWLHSTNSEEWLDRRTRYTRSLAVMSMVGYILGLGDRHPSNLMIDQQSGRVLHIDFGDCFEVAMHRDKYPEKIPFRLTRMLVKAMEVSGIEGSYRSTCERTMTVLRDNRDSLVTMLEAFVYDPLISWRLVGIGSSNRPSGELSLGGADMIVPEAPAQTNQGTTNEPVLPSAVSSNIVHESIAEGLDEDAEEPDGIRPLAGESVSERVHHAAQTHIAQNAAALSSSRAASVQQYYDMQSEMADLRQDTRLASIAGESAAAAEGSVARSRMARSLQQRQVMSWLEGEDGAAHEEALNEKALEVIRRVQDKLSGTDFCDPDDERELREPLDVSTQVSRLIVQATSTENLCQLFIGMCAFW